MRSSREEELNTKPIRGRLSGLPDREPGQGKNFLKKIRILRNSHGFIEVSSEGRFPTLLTNHTPGPGCPGRRTLTLADRQGHIALAECSAQGLEIIRPTAQRPFVFAANAFHSPKMAPLQGPQEQIWQSERRYSTLSQALARQKGQIPVSEAQKLLAGQYGFLCQYDPASGCDTLWSVVYDLKGKAIWQADGNPSRQSFIQDTEFHLH